MPTFDRRLLWTWQSDRRRTFRHFKPAHGCTPQSLRKFKGPFGKMRVRWGRRRYYSEYDGHQDSAAYEVVASDSVSVVIRHRDELSGETRLRQIHFDGDHYWLTVGGTLIEYFRRVE